MLVMFGLIMMVGEAQASCGLEMCPLDAAPTPRSALQARSLTRYTADPTTAAWYAETFVGGGVRLRQGVMLGASLPLLYVQDAAGGWLGLGNTVAIVDWQRDTLAAGLQLELPTTTRDTHDDAGHVVAFPYVRALRAWGRWDARARAGWGRSLSFSEEDHEHGVAFSPYAEVNPHSDSELQLRAEAGWQVSGVRPALSTAFIQEFGGDTLLTLNPVVELRREQILLRAQLEHPLTAARRFEQRVSLNVTYSPEARAR